MDQTFSCSPAVAAALLCQPYCTPVNVCYLVPFNVLAVFNTTRQFIFLEGRINYGHALYGAYNMSKLACQKWDSDRQVNFVQEISTKKSKRIKIRKTKKEKPLHSM